MSKRKRTGSATKGGGESNMKNMTLEKPIKPITKDDSRYFKIISWNVNGMSALLKKDTLQSYVEAENPDVIVFQETKYSEKKTPGAGFLGSKYPHEYWNCCTAKNGYSGTGLISKTKPITLTKGIGIPEHDDEGRVITAEFEHFYLICNYVPNAGQKLDRLEYRTKEWDVALLNYLKKLEQKKPIIWTGDLNVAHEEIDIFRPKGNNKTAGFTPEERKGFTHLLSQGFIDTYRHQHPTKQTFSYWGYRGGLKAQNKGWRLDYFVVSQSLLPMVGKSFIRGYVNGSDHCPIGILMAREKGQDMSESLSAVSDDEDGEEKGEGSSGKKRKTDNDEEEGED